MTNAPAASPSGQATVFLADPSTLVRARVRSLLEDVGIRVVGEGASAVECGEGIAACHPDVVVMEAQLAGGRGLDLLQALRACLPPPAVIVLTNNAAPAYRKRYLREGALHFLDKSNEFDRLAACVAGAARSRPM